MKRAAAIMQVVTKAVAYILFVALLSFYIIEFFK